MIRRMLQQTTVNGFSRLKGIFRSGINYCSYEQIVSTAKNKTVGNIPHDMLKLVISANPNHKKEAITAVQDMYTEAAVILSGVEKAQKQAIKRFPNNIESAVKIIENTMHQKNNFFVDRILEEKIVELALKAEQQIITRLSNIIPNVGNIKISHIGFGAFGNAFKCEIFDTNGKKLVADRVIKTFHDDSDFALNLLKKINSIISKYSSKNIEQYSSKMGKTLSKDDIQAELEKVKKLIEAESQISETSKRYNGMLHGAMAETNTAEYIRYMAGHKVGEKQGIVLFDMVNMGEQPYAISKFVDSKFTGIFTPPFNLKRLGLGSTDINPQNSINGVCIDIGGICPHLDLKAFKEYMEASGMVFSPDNVVKGMLKATKTKIVGDKISTRILKRLSHAKLDERENIIKDLIQEAEKSKDLIYKRKILETIREIKEKKLVMLKEHLANIEVEDIVSGRYIKNFKSFNTEA